MNLEVRILRIHHNYKSHCIDGGLCMIGCNYKQYGLVESCKHVVKKNCSTCFVSWDVSTSRGIEDSHSWNFRIKILEVIANFYSCVHLGKTNWLVNACILARSLFLNARVPILTSMNPVCRAVTSMGWKGIIMADAITSAFGLCFSDRRAEDKHCSKFKQIHIRSALDATSQTSGAKIRM